MVRSPEKIAACRGEATNESVVEPDSVVVPAVAVTESCTTEPTGKAAGRRKRSRPRA